MNNFTIVNIPMKPVYDNTSLLPLYQINNPNYNETTNNQNQNQNQNKIKYTIPSHGENNC